MLFAYFAPEVVLPMASVLAAAFGFVMMIGRAPFRLAARGFRAVRGAGKRKGALPAAQTDPTEPPPA